MTDYEHAMHLRLGIVHDQCDYCVREGRIWSLDELKRMNSNFKRYGHFGEPGIWDVMRDPTLFTLAASLHYILS